MLSVPQGRSQTKSIHIRSCGLYTAQGDRGSTEIFRLRNLLGIETSQLQDTINIRDENPRQKIAILSDLFLFQGQKMIATEQKWWQFLFPVSCVLCNNFVKLRIVSECQPSTVGLTLYEEWPQWIKRTVEVFDKARREMQYRHIERCQSGEIWLSPNLCLTKKGTNRNDVETRGPSSCCNMLHMRLVTAKFNLNALCKIVMLSEMVWCTLNGWKIEICVKISNIY